MEFKFHKTEETSINLAPLVLAVGLVGLVWFLSRPKVKAVPIPVKQKVPTKGRK